MSDQRASDPSGNAKRMAGNVMASTITILTVVEVDAHHALGPLLRQRRRDGRSRSHRRRP